MKTKKYPELYRRAGSKIYYFRVETADGRRSWKSTGATLKKEAEPIMRAFIDEQLAEASRPASGAETFAAYAARYYQWEKDKAPTCPHAARLLAEGKIIGFQHVREARRLVERVLEANPKFAGLRLDSIRRADAIDLRGALAAQFRPRIAQRMFSAIKTILAEAEFRQDIPSNPAASVGPVKIETRRRGAFTVAELRALLEAQPGRMGTEPRIAAFFTILAAAGLRAGEARGLRWKSVDIKGRRLEIVEAAQRDAEEPGPPKWHKARSIVLPKIAADALENWHKVAVRTGPEDFVYGDAKGRMLSQTVLRKAWASVLDGLTAEREGGPLVLTNGRWLSPHSLRHSLNTLLLSAGANPLSVAAFLGWSSDLGAALSKVQESYTHISLIDLRRVADLIDAELGPKADPGNVRQFA